MSDLSRRALLQASALSAALTPFLWLDPAGAATVKNLYSRSRFTTALNQGFTFASATMKWSSTLVAVSDLSPVVVPSDDNRYSLTFRTDNAGPAEGVYSFSRPGFAATTLFVTPDAARRYYQAVINRI